MEQIAIGACPPEEVIRPATLDRPVSYSYPDGVLVRQRLVGRGGYGSVYEAVFYKNGGILDTSGDEHYGMKEHGWGISGSPTVPLKTVKALDFKPADHILSKESVLQDVEAEKRRMHDIGQGAAYAISLADYDGVDDARERVFFTMPFAETTLHKYLKEPHTAYEVMALVRQAAYGIQDIHNRGYIHRDIKPENILLKDQKVLIADFGIAVHVQPVQGENMATFGTPPYAAPEQYTFGGALPASDQYALGVLTYRAFWGQFPTFREDSTGRKEVMPRNNTVTQRVLAPVINRALANNPNERFASMSDFGEELGTALTKASEECVRQAEIYVDVGNAHAQYSTRSAERQYNKALQLLDEALGNDPYNLSTYHRKAELLQCLGRGDELEHTLQAILFLTPKTPEEVAMQGDAYAGLGQHEEALRHYAKAEFQGVRGDTMDWTVAQTLEAMGEITSEPIEAVGYYTRAQSRYERLASRGVNTPDVMGRISMITQRLTDLHRQFGGQRMTQFRLPAIQQHA